MLSPVNSNFKYTNFKHNFLLRRFRLLKEQSHYNIFVCSFLRPCGETRRFLSAFCGSSKLCAFDGGSTNSSKWSLAIQNSLRNGEAQIFMCLPLPPVRTHILAVLGKIIKRWGWLPLTQIYSSQ